MDQIHLPGIGEMKIRRGVHIKYLRICMAPGRGMWVNVPYGVSGRQVEEFILRNRDWIVRQQKNVEVYEKDTGVGLGIGSEIHTKLHILRIVSTPDDRPSYLLEGKVITLKVPEKIDFSRIEQYAQNFLLNVYKLECEQLLPQRVRELADKFGFKYTSLTFRNNVSNWGSCSYDNHISLNIKLMKLPDDIIDYVILHELCHTVEKNHSADFWKLVGQVCPAFAVLRQRLRKYNTRI